MAPRQRPLKRVQSRVARVADVEELAGNRRLHQVWHPRLLPFVEHLREVAAAAAATPSDSAWHKVGVRCVDCGRDESSVPWRFTAATIGAPLTLSGGALNVRTPMERSPREATTTPTHGALV